MGSSKQAARKRARSAGVHRDGTPSYAQNSTDVVPRERVAVPQREANGSDRVVYDSTPPVADAREYEEARAERDHLEHEREQIEV